MTAKELKCYGCLDGNGEVEVYQINSCQFNDWCAMYQKDFKSSYISSGEKPLDVSQHYSDPDTSYRKGRDHSFFNDLETFLNKQEKNCSDSLKGSFKYRFIENEGIEVSGTDSNGKKMQPFYLRSDQFGFSAPTNRKAHPYDLYIAQHENKDEAIKQVIKWISMSRTIGGSFLWSKSPDDSARNSFYEKYNMRRGGTITCDRSKYIQDRVDLTLWEIKDWYSKHNGEKGIWKERSILESCSKEKPDIEHWLGHFKNFPTYVTYFMFDEFVSSDGLCNPINIITEKSDAPVRGADGKNPEPAITESMNPASLENMLETLNNRIVKRSIAMTKIIDG